MLVSSPNPEVLKDFIQFVHTNVSKELRKLHDLPHRVFEGRPHVIPVAQDLASEEARLRYALAQGTKEHLVRSPREVPFVTGVHSLERGVLVKGLAVCDAPSFRCSEAAAPLKFDSRLRKGGRLLPLLFNYHRFCSIIAMPSRRCGLG